MQGKDLVTLLKRHIGQPYVFGAFVPKDAKSWKGAFDCAEFVSYGIFQTYDFLYGTDLHDLGKASKADAYTGYFDVDARKYGKIISVEEATRTAGAILLRKPTGSAIGHVVVSQGNGKTIEAHSTKYGVIESKVDGRRWDYGILLPNVEYEQGVLVIAKPPILIYELKTPIMKDAYVKKIQEALMRHGFDVKGVDSAYGKNTQSAVVAFQKAKGLIPDGEIMAGGETARELGI